MADTWKHIEFAELRADELERANRIYAAIAFATSKPDQDRTFAAYQGGELVGLGRINAYADGALELGGIWTAETYRGQGLGRHVVAHVLAQMPRGRLCYCIPFAYLADFYLSFGMTEVEAGADLPGSIRAKLDLYHERHAQGIYAPVVLLALKT